MQSIFMSNIFLIAFRLMEQFPSFVQFDIKPFDEDVCVQTSTDGSPIEGTKLTQIYVMNLIIHRLGPGDTTHARCIGEGTFQHNVDL